LGASLRGWLFRPPAAHAPVVVMAHGFSATRSMTTDKYAEAFCSKGFAVLLYDHRGFGASGGEPRVETNPWTQTRGYIDAVEFISSADGIDPDRIAIWGDSLSGGVACVAAAIDPRIRAVVVQVPAFGEKLPPPDSEGKRFEILRKTALSRDVLNYGRPTLGPVPVVSADQVRQPSALKPLSAFHWFIEYGGRVGSGWVNDVTVALGETPIPWQPGLCGPHIDVPVLMIVSPEDEMMRANPSVARAVFESLKGPKEWHAIAGGHFGLLYHPSEIFDEAQEVQVSFLRRWLGDDIRPETHMTAFSYPRTPVAPSKSHSSIE
jgi:pimeloyl-ACP methyl ester carboxylesterase